MASGSQPSPSVQTSSSSAKFPDELKPYITDILTRAKKRAEDKDAAGYQQYEGARIAQFDPATIQAQEGISGMVGGSQPYYDEAQRLASQSTGQFDQAAAQKYMSPYMQSVVEIEKREGERDYNQMQQAGAAQDVASGGFGGSRTGLREALQNKSFLEQQGDIQTKGLQSAFQTAGQQFESQKAREAAGANAYAQLGQQVPASQMKEFQNLASVGAQKEAQAQQALDLGYSDFFGEQSHPDRVLQEYQSIIRGFPLDPSMSSESFSTKAAPSLGSEVAGGALTAASLYNAFSNNDGGKVDSGLAGIISRQLGGQTNNNLTKLKKKLRDKGMSEEEAEITVQKMSEEAPSTAAAPSAVPPNGIAGTPPMKTAREIATGQMNQPMGMYEKELMNAAVDRRAGRADLEKQALTDANQDKWLRMAGIGAKLAGSTSGSFLQDVSGVGQEAAAAWAAGKKGERDVATDYSDKDREDLSELAGIERQAAQDKLAAAKLLLDWETDRLSALSWDATPISPAVAASVVEKVVDQNALSKPETAQKLIGLEKKAKDNAMIMSRNNNDYNNNFQTEFAKLLIEAGLAGDASDSGLVPTVPPKNTGLPANPAAIP
tara:strand:- start:24263 stop:26074 length:1812 start_codon:yes stop_codon:yes gene_type:complete